MMTLPPCTSLKASEVYLRRLACWAERVDRYSGPKKDKWMYEIDTFPKNRIGDIVLITQQEGFDFTFMGTRMHCGAMGYYKDLVGHRARIVARFDYTTAEYHGSPEGDNYDFILRLDTDGEILVDPGAPLGGQFVFLPHPSQVNPLKKLLSHLSKKTKKLETLLDGYYNGLCDR